MLNFEINGENVTCHASGTHRDMLAEAMVLESELQRFVYRLGYAEYLLFVVKMQEIMQSDEFFDFLQSKPDEETHITMSNFNREGEKDAE